MNQPEIITVINILVYNLGIFIDSYTYTLITYFLKNQNGIILSLHVCFTNTPRQAALGPNFMHIHYYLFRINTRNGITESKGLQIFKVFDIYYQTWPLVH